MNKEVYHRIVRDRGGSVTNIVNAGFGFSELVVLHTAVMKKVVTEKISYSRAAFALMDGIDTSEKLLDAKKQLNDS